MFVDGYNGYEIIVMPDLVIEKELGIEDAVKWVGLSI